jgi:plastocyanin
MFTYSSTMALAATLLCSLTSAIAIPPLTINPTGVVHRITAGSTVANNGLHFEPENVVAQPGDMIEFHFLPKAHSVVQSSFAQPCAPLGTPDAFFSGFNFNTTAGEAPNVFTFMIKDTNPIWYYCSQTNNNHCQMGMSGVINQNFNDNDKTLAKYKEAAKGTMTKQPSTDPMKSQGGQIKPNVPL